MRRRLHVLETLRGLQQARALLRSGSEQSKWYEDIRRVDLREIPYSVRYDIGWKKRVRGCLGTLE